MISTGHHKADSVFQEPDGSKGKTMEKNIIERYHHCFVCGDENEIGLKIDFYHQDGKAKACFTPMREYEGYRDILHGGIIASVLDEVMVKAVLAEGIPALTSRMDVRFRLPALVGEELFLEGWITQRKSRLIMTAGKVFRKDGTIIAEANGTYFRVQGETARKLTP